MSLFPKSTEGEQVSTCLKVFSENTYNAHLNLSGLSDDKKDIFINKVLTGWKILNVKALGTDIRHKDPLEAEIRSPDDSWLDFIITFGKMALNMTQGQSNSEKISRNIHSLILYLHDC